MALRILIAEQEDAFRRELSRALDDHEVFEAASGAEARAALEQYDFSLLVTNLAVGDICGLTLMEQAKSADPEALVVVTVGQAGTPAAVQALRLGAYDCLPKPCEDILMSAILNRAVERVKLARENQNLLSSLRHNVEAFGDQNRRLERMATRDALTGLFNRRYFCETFEMELNRSRRHDHLLSLVFADVDYFKQFNDTQGHPAGDVLLTRLAKLLASTSRNSTVVARYGGEEFVLLVPESDHKGALLYAERLRSRVETYPFPGREHHPGGKITMSFGVATFPEHGNDADTLLKYADDALYAAKKAGRNTVRG